MIIGEWEEWVSSLSHQGTIEILWPQEWSWQDNINGMYAREMTICKNFLIFPALVLWNLLRQSLKEVLNWPCPWNTDNLNARVMPNAAQRSLEERELKSFSETRTIFALGPPLVPPFHPLGPPSQPHIKHTSVFIAYLKCPSVQYLSLFCTTQTWMSHIVPVQIF